MKHLPSKLDGESGELLIKNHTDSNTGIYVCEAKNSVGQAQCKYTLHAYNRKWIISSCKGFFFFALNMWMSPRYVLNVTLFLLEYSYETEDSMWASCGSWMLWLDRSGSATVWCLRSASSLPATNKVGVIVGAVIGALLLFLLLLLLIWLLVCCCQKKRYQKEAANEIRYYITAGECLKPLWGWGRWGRNSRSEYRLIEPRLVPCFNREDAPAPESRPSSRHSSRHSSFQSTMGYRTHQGVQYTSVGDHLSSIRESAPIYPVESNPPSTAGDRATSLTYDHRYGYAV